MKKNENDYVSIHKVDEILFSEMRISGSHACVTGKNIFISLMLCIFSVFLNY